VATLDSWGVNSKLVPDLAMLLDPAQDNTPSESAQSLGLRPGHPVVGLALTATEPGLGEKALQVIPEVMRRMQDVDFVFIPMSQHPVITSHNDLALAKKLQAAAPALKVLYGYHHPARVLGYFGELDAAVCMRFHSMVFAERAGTPMVAVSYAEKTKSWIEERGMKPADLTPDAMTAAIRQAIAQRHAAVRKAS
jgi:polysaccharide pyruvyl transferase WcaK-like protein